MEERGIPIDYLGGTSIGAFIGGLYAREGDLLSSDGRAKHFSSRMSNIWRLLSDVTYPIVAYTTVSFFSKQTAVSPPDELGKGHEFNRGIYKSFYDLHIEDMWLPFFCNVGPVNLCSEVQRTYERLLEIDNKYPDISYGDS